MYIKGLSDKITGAVTQSFNGIFNIAVSCNYKNRDGLVKAVDPPQEFNTIHLSEFNVCDNEINKLSVFQKV